jgi:hypothetical protein
MNQDQLSLDKQRVSLLLNINTLLIQKSIMLQHQLKEQQQQQQQQQQSSNLSKLTELLQHLLKRLHSNLTCIGELSERQNNNSPAQQKKLIFPTILNPPPEFFEFNEYYIALQKLFPEGVAVLTQRIKQQMNGQIPGGVEPNSSSSSSRYLAHYNRIQPHNNNSSSHSRSSNINNNNSSSFGERISR